MVEGRDRKAGEAPTAPPEATTVHEERIVGADEVEATRAEIGQTRAASIEDIDAPREKPDPPEAEERATSRATPRAASAFRRNPAVPLAVAGGLVLLLLLRLRSRGRAETVLDLSRGGKVRVS